MVKKKSARSKPIDPFKTFYNARSFRLSVRVLSKEPQENVFFWPANTCEALALELHLKCLHHIRRRYSLQTHQIKNLYEALSRADKRRINKYLTKILSPYRQRAKQDGILLDVGSIISRANRMFIWSRYWHEEMQQDEDITGLCSNIGVSDLSDAVAMVIQDARPQWTEKMLDSFTVFRSKNDPPPT